MIALCREPEFQGQRQRGQKSSAARNWSLQRIGTPVRQGKCRSRSRIRCAILGHEEETVAAGYGEGFPVTLLRKWIETIGF